MWILPWGYREGWTICTGLTLTGLAMQNFVGEFDVAAMPYPVNVAACAILAVVAVTVHALSRKYVVFRWFSSPQASITALAFVLFMSVIEGLGVATINSWAFTLVFAYLLLVLAAVVMRRLRKPKLKRDAGFVFSHAGLLLALVAASLGSGDLQRLRMTVARDAAEWRAANERNELVELPLAIELKSFDIDEYPPELMLIDNETGETLPRGKPTNVLIEACPTVLSLSDWEIEVVRYLPAAASVMTKDTAFFTEFLSEGATSALFAKARHKTTGVSSEGWVSCGNHVFPYRSLRLSDDESLIMPPRKPKRFASEVRVYSKEGESRESVIEVNRPLKYEGWKIYQLSYDESRGKWSHTSVFELVRDPWLPAVYAGIFMMLVGAIFLFLSSTENQTYNKKNKE
ncbi:MAG: cytochrome c biogenesis protein ResB [Prevotellaceae bacterium]|jgi:hypothetical protein|nr:cytochrome c biogenesis protein ResB [Prevotellaceae bacterium]